MPEEQRIAVPAEFDPEDEYRPEPEPEPLPPAWMDGKVRIGIHTSIAGSYRNALESARKLGCNSLQIFSASPRMWQGRPARIPEDRKSTRLNSSHTVISYAVFCLKKKNKKK